MKHFISFFAAAFISVGAFSQLPDGSIAPDFTAIDINGNEHNLYALLDSGYQVILEFSATWCPPCWDYHEAGILDTLYETYGPEGTNELRVFFLESDDSTDSADLNGTGNGTQGDWVTGTTYPIIDNAGNIFDDYLNVYFPTIYTVCPNRILTQSGQTDVASHASIFQDANCGAASELNDAYLVDYTGETVTCGGSPVSISVRLMNTGLDALTACTITAYDGATALGSVDWTGSLDTYEVEEVEVTTASLASSTSITIEVTSGDDNANNNSVSAEVIAAVESTNNVRFTLVCDAYPGEIAWAVFDDLGNVVEQSPFYGANDIGVEHEYNWSLPIGCYTFVITDAFGDGLWSSWYNGTGPDGMFSLDAMGGEEGSENLFSYAAPDQYEEIVLPFEVTQIFTIIEGCTDPLASNYDPSASIDDGSCVFFATTCEYIGTDGWADQSAGVFIDQPQVEHEYGVYIYGEAVLHLPGFIEDENGGFYTILGWNNLQWSGLPSGLSFTNPPSQIEANSQLCVTYNGTPSQVGTFEVSVSGELMLDVFGNPFSAGPLNSSFTMVISPNAEGIWGCTYSNATNYMPEATNEDGSCFYAGCMTPEACNFQIFATVDDGSCTFDCATNDGPCMFDANGDGSVGSGDLLQFLTAFGETCE